MGDIVGELRELADHISSFDSGSGDANLLRNVADEIEQLTKKLKRAKSVNNAAWSEGHRQGMLAAGAII